VTSNDRETRWASEAAFFDAKAQEALKNLKPIEPRTMLRYSEWKRRRVAKEFLFRVLGPLAGKNVLDVGCGDGLFSVQLAKVGASVVGMDISPEAIAVSRRRAEIDGVGDKTTFVCGPIEAATVSGAQFDVVVGIAILHHVIADLEDLVPRLVSFAKPGGQVAFIEPVNRFEPLRRFRRLIPIAGDYTPDERPLEQAELAIVQRHVPDLIIRSYNLLGRLVPFVLRGEFYEHATGPKRLMVESIWLTDYAALSLPFIDRLGGTAVLFGHRPA